MDAASSQLHDRKLFQLGSIRQVVRNGGNSFAQGSELTDRFRVFPILMETEEKITGVPGF